MSQLTSQNVIHSSPPYLDHECHSSLDPLTGFVILLYLDHECHSSLDPLAAKRALACLPKRRRSRLRALVDVRRTTASRHQEQTRTRRTKAQRDSAPLRTAKHSAGLIKQPEKLKLLLGAAQARRSRIDRHRLAASTITSTKSRRLQKTASEVEPSAQSDESTAFR